MKEKIIELRDQGLSYKEIKKILGCSLGTISYHCGENQKDKTKKRNQKNQLSNTLAKKTNKFKNKKIDDKVYLFKKKGVKGKKSRSMDNCKNPFTIKDVIAKFGDVTNCYLTGKRICLSEPKTYHLDHIIPPFRGGKNELDNVGITCPEANIAKNGMLVEEFLDLCKRVLEYQGFIVSK